MAPKHDHGHIHWNELTVPCPDHSGHTCIIAGLDFLADECAGNCIESLRASGIEASLRRSLIDVSSVSPRGDDIPDDDDHNDDDGGLSDDDYLPF